MRLRSALFGGAGRRAAALVVAAFSSVGCGSSSNGDPPQASDDGGTTPANCRGFPFEGLRYSPGGSVLPNTCEPFDAFTNNPYAVRCVDAMPAYATRYPGDDYCVLPPPPEQGLQIGVHPQGAGYWSAIWAGDLSGYADDGLTKPFELEPGGEVEQAFRTNMDNTEERFFYRIDSRMRVGSHHMATYLTNEPGQEGWGTVFGPGVFAPDGVAGFFWNSQRSNSDRPASTLDIAKEDLGLGSPVAAHQGIVFDLHHFNTLEGPILREAWINVWWVDGPVDRRVDDRPLHTQIDVPPNSLKEIQGSFTADAATRVLSLFGHRHAWTTRFNATLQRADGSQEPVYDSFDWLDVPTYSYDSLSKNPLANPSMRKDGAASGILTLEPGDELRFTCHVDTTAVRAAELGVPVPTETLQFGNKAYSAEMCILYSQTVVAGAP